MVKNNEDDNLRKKIKKIILVLVMLAVLLLPASAITSSGTSQNALGGAIISSGYDNTIGIVGSYLTDNDILTSINSTLFISNNTLASLENELREITWVDIVAENVIQCESQNQMIWGDLDLPIHAYGIAQFQERTFNWMKAEANAPTLNYYDRDDQEWLLKWAIKNGYGSHWTCYKLLYES